MKKLILLLTIFVSVTSFGQYRALIEKDTTNKLATQTSSIRNQDSSEQQANAWINGTIKSKYIGVGMQPYSYEDVGIWSNVTGIGGSTGVLRAAQFYATYTGTNASTGLDVVANDSATSNNDHMVGVQIVSKNSGAKINNLYGIKFAGTNLGDTVSNAYGVYLGGFTGTKYINKYAFYSAGSEQSSLNGALSVSGKFAFGLSDALGDYAGLFQGTNPIYEYKNGSTTMVYMGTASIVFGGYDNNDFGIMQNGAARNIVLGVNGTPVLKIEKTQATINTPIVATQYKLSALNTAPATATDTGTLGEIRVTAGFIYVCTATNVWVRAALSSW